MGGGQGGCERRIEVVVKMKIKIGKGEEGQGECERRLEVFVKMQKKKIIGKGVGRGGGRGVRVNKNEELKFL